MTIFKLCEWEVNGYNDSDWLMSVYDDELNTISTIMIGTTRFASGINYHGAQDPTPEIVERARLVLVETIHQRLIAADRVATLTPDNVSVDEVVCLIAPHKNAVANTTPCNKCSGTGYWVNPRNPIDKRACFTCEGRGTFKGEKVKDATGKVVWDRFEPGLTGTVVKCHAYGTFYRNGYNQPGRENRQGQHHFQSRRQRAILPVMAGHAGKPWPS